MLIDNLLWVVGMVGLFRYLIYAIGEPHHEYNPKSILAHYSAFLGRLRMEQIGIYEEPFYESGGSNESQIINKEMAMSYVVNRIKPVAGWLNAVGYCPICSSFWFMLLFVLIPTGSIAWFGVSLLITKIIFKWI